MSTRNRVRVLVIALGLTAALGGLAPAASAEDIIECTHASGGPKGWDASCTINPPVALGDLG